ncbi:MAG: 5-(carboxyamino)imidazole ribonucleotide synthase [Actinomycetes bacterium]
MAAPGGAGPRVGFIGGGQLARMCALAAAPLGIRTSVLAAPTDEGAAEVVAEVVRGAAHDPDALRAFAATVDVLTIDHENVDHDTLQALERAGVVVRPSVGTLRFSDKAFQRQQFAAAGLPVPDFVIVDADDPDAVATVDAFAQQHGARVVVKASRGGYDGRGVWVLAAADVPEFLDAYDGAPLVVEPFLPLDGEVAVLVARRPSGEVAVWPVVETVQVDGMCDEVLVTEAFVGGLLTNELAAAAQDIGRRVAEVTGAVGVLAVELFVVDGALLINEIAPRVHNSGHFTIEGSSTSQFEQHLRAVLDWPLGPTTLTAPCAVMRNVVGGAEGDPRDRQAAALARVPEAHLHLYGKVARPSRKVGHVTVLGADLSTCRAQAQLAADLLAGG